MDTPTDAPTDPIDGEGLGTYVRRVRVARGWSQDYLAARVGMSRGYLSQVEVHPGKWPTKYVAGLAAALGVAPSALGRAAGRIVRDDGFPVGAATPTRPPTLKGGPPTLRAASAAADARVDRGAALLARLRGRDLENALWMLELAARAAGGAASASEDADAGDVSPPRSAGA